MKTMYVLSLLAIMVTSHLLGQSIKVMTYNIRYDNKGDTINNWNDRRAGLVKMLKEQEPDFIGVQEAQHHQMTYIDSSLTNYKYLGVGRDDGRQKGEYSAIFYKAKLYDVLQYSTIWLSKTPNKPSVGWDAALERVCTYASFENKKTKKKLWVFNTHFDHIGVLAREKSAELILNHIKKVNVQNDPLVLMGDLNLTPQEKPIVLIKKELREGFEVSKTPPSGPKGTFNGFDTKAPIDRRIDYIFVKGFTVENYTHINERLDNGKHLSDHLPVLATLSQ